MRVRGKCRPTRVQFIRADRHGRSDPTRRIGVDRRSFVAGAPEAGKQFLPDGGLDGHAASMAGGCDSNPSSARGTPVLTALGLIVTRPSPEAVSRLFPALMVATQS